MYIINAKRQDTLRDIRARAFTRCTPTAFSETSRGNKACSSNLVERMALFSLGVLENVFKKDFPSALIQSHRNIRIGRKMYSAKVRELLQFAFPTSRSSWE